MPHTEFCMLYHRQYLLLAITLFIFSGLRLLGIYFTGGEIALHDGRRIPKGSASGKIFDGGSYHAGDPSLLPTQPPEAEGL
jgi:hypothetical protein